MNAHTTTHTDTTRAMFPLSIVSTITVDGEERTTWTGSPCTTEQAYGLLHRLTAELVSDLTTHHGITAEVIGGENENYVSFTDTDGSRVTRTIAVRRTA